MSIKPRNGEYIGFKSIGVYMSSSLNSFNEGYIVEYMGFSGLYRGVV